MKLNVIEHLKNLTENKVEFDIHNEEQTKSYNQFIINRFISMTDIFVPIVNEINKYDIPKETHYRYFFNILPKRRHYFKYIKSKADITDDEKECISKYFKCGSNDIKNHLLLMSKEQIKSIVDLYK